MNGLIFMKTEITNNWYCMANNHSFNNQYGLMSIFWTPNTEPNCSEQIQMASLLPKVTKEYECYYIIYAGRSKTALWKHEAARRGQKGNLSGRL